MRLIYFGTGDFAVPTLQALSDSIELVVTQPDRPAGRGLRLQPSPVKLAALTLGLKVESPEKSRSPTFVQLLRDRAADALLVASYGQILSQAVLDSASKGGINLHGSILPKYRGAAPIQRCILDGETETGISLMQMGKGMDTGDVIDIRTAPIGPDETYTELQDRLAIIAAEMAVQWMPRIVAGDFERTPQDSSAATLAPKIDRSETWLDFGTAASEAYNRFRAFTANPGAFLNTRFGTIRIHEARLDGANGKRGTVFATSPDLIVGFAQGAISLRQVQLQGKKRVSGRDFANGARLRPGDSLIE